MILLGRARSNLHAFHLLGNLRNPSTVKLFLLLRYPRLEFINKRRQVDQDTFFLRVAIWETHFLNLDLSGGHFILAKDDSEGDAALLGSFELLRELGFEFIGELGLYGISLFVSSVGK